MSRLFDTRPGYDAAIFADAQELADAGLDLDSILDLFPEDADWLAPLIDTTGTVINAFAAEEPSFYFEASLKNRFIAAGRRAAYEPPRRAPLFNLNLSPLRTLTASFAVTAAAAAIGVVTLGFITSASAVPGDWNYSFKIANERINYALARGDSRVDIQFRQAESRVQEISVLSSRGSVSPQDLNTLESAARTLETLAKNQPLDSAQRARGIGITAQGSAVLNDVRQKQPDLQPEVSAAAAAVDAAVAAVAPPTPTATPTATVVEEPAPASVTPTAGTPSPSATQPPAATTPTAAPSSSTTPSTGR